MKDGGGQQCRMRRKGKLERGRKEVSSCPANGGWVKDSFCRGPSAEATARWLRQCEGVGRKWRLGGHGKGRGDVGDEGSQLGLNRAGF